MKITPENNELRTPSSVRTRTWLLAAFALLLCEPALAIPSPDLVINLSASVAQLLGLLSVVFGGFAVSAKKKVKKRNGGSSVGGKILLTTALVLLMASLASNVLQYTGGIDAKNQRLQTNLVRKSVENEDTPTWCNNRNGCPMARARSRYQHHRCTRR